MKRSTFSLRAEISAWLLYAGLVVALVWPLLEQPTTRLPMGTEQVRTVPLFNLWTIEWNADRLRHGLRDYWNAPIFFPDKGAFAYSEPQPFTMLLAPIVWVGSATLAYNIYMVISLWLNGYFAHRLLKLLGFTWPAVISGGLMLISLPIIHWQLGVVQLVPLWGILWTLSVVIKLDILSTPSLLTSLETLDTQAPTVSAWRHGIELGASLAVTSLMAIYHALFMATLLVPMWLIFGKRLWSRQIITATFVAVLTCLVITSPMIGPMLGLARNDEFARAPELIEQLSLSPSSYLSVFGYSPWSGLYWPTENYWRVNPGWLKMVLLVIGLGAGLSSIAMRSCTRLLLAFVVTAFILSLGWHLQLGSFNLWEWLMQTLPGFKQVRSPFRYAYFVHIAVALGAAGGIETLIRQARCLPRSSWRIATLSFVCVIATAAIADPWPLPVATAAKEWTPQRLALGVAPDMAEAEDWCNALREACASEPGAALCLPMAAGNEARDFELTCIWMLYGMRHGVPLINGYSGFCPQRVLDLGSEILEHELTDQQLMQLYETGLRYLVVDSNLTNLPWQAGTQPQGLQLKLLIRSQSGVEVYSVRRVAR